MPKQGAKRSTSSRKPVPVSSTQTPPLRAVIYARKSSDDKKSEDQSLSVSEQIIACEKLAKREGYRIVGTLTDDGISGRTPPAGYDTVFSSDRITNDYIQRMRIKTRPGLGAVCKLIEAQKIDLILVRDSTRIARPKFMSTLMNWIPSLLLQYGVKVHSVLEGIWDPANQQQAMFGMIKDALVDDEISKRAKLALEAKKKLKHAGVYRGKAPFGLTHEGSLYYPDTQNSDAIKRLFALRAKGLSFHRIAQDFTAKEIRRRDGKFFSQNHLKNLVDNPIYAGRINIGTVEMPDFIEAKNVKPVIPFDLFRACFDSTTSNRVLFKDRPRAAGGAMLSGLIVCGNCRGGMSRTTSASRKDRQTGKRDYTFRYACNQKRLAPGNCEVSSTILAEQIEPFMEAFLALKTVVESVRRREYQQRKAELPRLLKEVEALRTKRVMLIEDRRLDTETLTVLAAGLGKQIAELQREIHEIESLPESSGSQIAGLIEARRLTNTEKRDILRDYIKGVVVYPEFIVIEFVGGQRIRVERLRNGHRTTLPKIRVIPESNTVTFIINGRGNNRVTELFAVRFEPYDNPEL